jgi:hypothetical protein
MIRKEPPPGASADQCTPGLRRFPKTRDAVRAHLWRSILFGIVLIIAGFLVGPGGVSIFK